MSNTHLFSTEPGNNKVSVFLEKFPTMNIPEIKEKFSQLSDTEQGIVFQRVGDRGHQLLREIKNNKAIYIYTSKNFGNTQKIKYSPDALQGLTPSHLNTIDKIHANLDNCFDTPRGFFGRNYFPFTVNTQDLLAYANADNKLHNALKSSYKYRLSICPNNDKYEEPCRNHEHHGIFIRYYNKLTPTLFFKKIFSPKTICFTAFTVATVLHNYLIAAPTLKELVLTQDPLALALYNQLKNHNDTIQQLIKNQIAGSENLIPCIINEVPFKDSSENIGTRFKILLEKSILFGTALSTTLLPRLEQNTGIFMNGKIRNPKLSYSYMTILESVLRFSLGTIISIPCNIVLIRLSDYFFKNGFSYGSTMLITTILLLRAFFVIIDERILGKTMEVIFEDDKTVSESIQELLNDPSIEIAQ